VVGPSSSSRRARECRRGPEAVLWPYNTICSIRYILTLAIDDSCDEYATMGGDLRSAQCCLQLCDESSNGRSDNANIILKMYLVYCNRLGPPNARLVRQGGVPGPV